MIVSKDNSESKMPRGLLPTWSVSQAAVAASMVVLMQITFYATEVLGLSPGLIGAILMGTKFLDAATDLVAGYVVDRTNTRWGKGRPLHLFVVPLWISIILLYSTPDIGTAGKAIWVAFMYSMAMSVCYTMLMASGGVYTKRAVSGAQRQGKLLAVTGVVSMFICAACSIMLPQLMTRWGAMPGGWSRIALVYGLPMMVLGAIRVFFIKETVDTYEEDKQNKLGIVESLKLIFKNKYALMMAGSAVIDNLARNISGVAAAYYFTYVVGNLGTMSLVSTFGILAPLTLLLFPLAQRTIGGMNFVRINLVVAAAAYAVLLFAGSNLPLVITFAVIGGIGLNCLAMINTMFLIHTIDYGEWHTGKRVEGMCVSFYTFSSKVGNGLASLIAGGIMMVGGYVVQAETQTPVALIPALCCIGVILALICFDLEKRMPEISKDLRERQAPAQV